MSKPFAVVASMRDRLSVAGDDASVAALLAVHAPSAILPGAWPDTTPVTFGRLPSVCDPHRGY